MFKMKRLLFLVLSISLIGCENKSKNILKVESQTIENENIKETKGQLKEFTNEELAKFTISSIMGQSPKIMKAEKADDIYYISYIRPSDSQKFESRIKFDGDRIYWATIDGRWRNDTLDEKITFIEENKSIKIIQIFSDSSSSTDTYSKSDL